MQQVNYEEEARKARRQGLLSVLASVAVLFMVSYAFTDSLIRAGIVTVGVVLFTLLNHYSSQANRQAEIYEAQYRTETENRIKAGKGITFNKAESEGEKRAR